jgi:hypothetical protein
MPTLWSTIITLNSFFDLDFAFFHSSNSFLAPVNSLARCVAVDNIRGSSFVVQC